MFPQVVALALVWCVGTCENPPASFTPIAGWDNQLFPSYLIATASAQLDTEQPANHLGDDNGQLGVRLQATRADQEVQVTILGNDFFESSQWSGRLAKKGETYEIYPKIRFHFDKLASCHQATPTTIVFRVKIGDQAAQERVETVTVCSINDCPFSIIDGDEVIDTSFTFAAYVNEQHPFVDKLLREALDLGIVDKFDGYQSGEADEVIGQVYALWDLLVARDVRYSSITTTAASSERIASQHVRMIEQTANNSQANCVDGAVLLVSMLRKIDIEAELVMQPEHCYVAFWLDPDGEEIVGLETTLLGSLVDAADEDPELLEGVMAESRNEVSWASFAAAIEEGELQLAEDLERADQVDYAIINISDCRASGILPIPFSGQEQFEAYDFSAYLSAQGKKDGGAGQPGHGEASEKEADGSE